MSLKTIKTGHFIVLSLLIIGFTFLFKWKTGSFLTMGEQTQKEVMKFEIQKRKGSLSVKSLEASCYSIENLHNQIIEDLLAQNDSCSKFLLGKFSALSVDSIYLKSVQAIYEHAWYYDTEVSGSLKTLTLYQDKNTSCTEAVLLLFEKNKNQDFLLKEIQNFAKYYSCTCAQ